LDASLLSGWQPPSCGKAPSSSHAAIREWGCHAEGNYVIAYLPEEPVNPSKVVIYLHGFALGSPALYREHLYHLVSQGYYPIFIDYQKDSYQGSTYDPDEDVFNDIEDLVKSALDSLQITALQTLQNAINNALYALQQLELTAKQPEIYIFGHSVGGFLSLSWVYGLTKATIAGSGDPPVSLSQETSNGLALTPYQKELLTPKAIVAASPMVGTASLPPFVEKFVSSGDLPPFLQNPLTIAEVGSALAGIPIAMLLGADDEFASPQDWQNTSKWDSIASTDKRMYISRRYAKESWFGLIKCYAPRTTQSGSLLSPEGGNQLYPYHNQAVTNAIFSDSVSESVQISVIGGPGKLDAMRCNYIWSGLDQVLASTGSDKGVEDIQFEMGNWTCPKSGMTVPLAKVVNYP
jgi:acetyl esterase/lipase